MALTTSDMRRFAELGASLEIVTFVTEIVTRDENVTKRDGKAMTPAERARRYREKHKNKTVTARHEKVTVAKSISPTPPSNTLLKSLDILMNNKGLEEDKGLEITREGELFHNETVTGENVTKRDVTKRATIMPEDFFPDTKVWNDPEISNLTEHEKQLELQAMKDWSASRAGSKGKMLDWNRFARGWFRRHAKERGPQNGKGNGHAATPKLNSVDRAAAELRADIARRRGGTELGQRDFPSDLLAANVPRLR